MLDPQARALLDLIEASGLPAIHTLDASEARHVYRERRTYSQPEPPAVAEVRELAADGPAGAIPLRLFRPQGPQAGHRLPALVYYHGGGWTIGDLDTHDTLCRQLANASRCTVISVDYRMGPEHRFPAAVDDCVAATRWVHAHAGELGIDATRLAVGGDSAGGTLAAACAIHARDQGWPLALQLLIYPGTSPDQRTDSHERYASGYILDAPTIQWFFGNYLRGDEDRQDWRFAPLVAEDLRGLAPAWIAAAEYDPLRDEDFAYAQRLREAGVPVECVEYPGMIHAFFQHGGFVPAARRAHEDAGAALRRAFASARDAS